jgi:hypothetical protein
VGWRSRVCIGCLTLAWACPPAAAELPRFAWSVVQSPVGFAPTTLAIGDMPVRFDAGGGWECRVSQSLPTYDEAMVERVLVCDGPARGQHDETFVWCTSQLQIHKRRVGKVSLACDPRQRPAQPSDAPVVRGLVYSPAHDPVRDVGLVTRDFALAHLRAGDVVLSVDGFALYGFGDAAGDGGILQHVYLDSEYDHRLHVRRGRREFDRVVPRSTNLKPLPLGLELTVEPTVRGVKADDRVSVTLALMNLSDHAISYMERIVGAAHFSVGVVHAMGAPPCGGGIRLRDAPITLAPGERLQWREEVYVLEGDPGVQSFRAHYSIEGVTYHSNEATLTRVLAQQVGD